MIAKLKFNLVRRQRMLPLEQAIAPHLKALGFRKKARTWWITTADTIGVLNLQKSSFGERLYINLGVYLRQLGQEVTPPEHRCHVQVRLENIASEHSWNAIASAESAEDPSTELLNAVLNDGVSWLSQVSTLDGMRTYIRAGDSNKGLIMLTVRELVDKNNAYLDVQK